MNHMESITIKIRKWSPYISLVALVACTISAMANIKTNHRLDDAEYEIYKLKENIDDLESTVDDLESALYTISAYL